MSKPVIELHQFKSAMDVPNPSPFCMKLEGVLKLAEIDYKVVIQNDPRKAPKGKLPYIIHNKRKVADSNIVIDYLKNNLSVDLDSHLSDEEKAIHHAMRVMLDEQLYFVMMYNRWAVDEHWEILRNDLFGAIPKLLRNVITNKIRSGVLADLNSQGMSRHSTEEVYQIGVEAIEALAAYLGEKEWFGGDKPCTLDVCAVSYLANFKIPPMDSPMKQLVYSEKKLSEYVDRGLKTIYGS
ncbi:MAG: glutathione S-transferase family protein [Pseudomonadales bacterium]|nr:glutathione S-transferase family protein [Pseudomonadales bacterium]